MNDALTDPDIEAFLAEVGLTFLVTHLVERSIGGVLLVVLGPDTDLSAQVLERLTNDARAKTLGQLIATLRRSVPLDPHFESVLNAFLTDRNTFIHHFDSDEGFDPHTPSGRQNCFSLMRRLRSHADLLLTTIGAFAIAFFRTIGASTPIDSSTPLAQAMIDDSYRVWGLIGGPKRARVMPPWDSGS